MVPDGADSERDDTEDDPRDDEKIITPSDNDSDLNCVIVGELQDASRNADDFNNTDEVSI